MKEDSHYVTLLKKIASKIENEQKTRVTRREPHSTESNLDGQINLELLDAVAEHYAKAVQENPDIFKEVTVEDLLKENLIKAITTIREGKLPLYCHVPGGGVSSKTRRHGADKTR